jgi:hypothetical protein
MLNLKNNSPQRGGHQLVRMLICYGLSFDGLMWALQMSAVEVNIALDMTAVIRQSRVERLEAEAVYEVIECIIMIALSWPAHINRHLICRQQSRLRVYCVF